LIVVNQVSTFVSLHEMRVKLYIIIILLSSSIYAQKYINDIDSILKVINTSLPEDEAQNYLMIGFCTRDYNPDTAFFYDKIGLKLANELSNDTLLIVSYNNIAMDYKLLGDFENAEKNFILSIKYSKKVNNLHKISSSYNNIGVLYSDRGQYNKALEFFIKSLKIDEKLQDTVSIALSYNNIGMIHYNIEDYDRALRYYEMGLELKQKMKDKDGEALLLMNIGIIYYFKDDYERVLSYFNNALSIWTDMGNLRRIALIKSNIGELYVELELYQESRKYLMEAKEIYTDLNEVFDIIQTNLLIGELYAEEGNYIKATELYNEALVNAKNVSSLAEEVDVYKAFKKMYIKKKDYNNAYLYLEKYHAAKDSIFNNEKSNKIEELEAKYQSEKKEQKIELMKKDKLVGELQQKKLRITIYSISIGFLLLIGLIFYVFRAYKIKKEALIQINKQKNEIAEKNTELNQQNEEILAQRDEIEQQRDVANEQRDVIYKQKESITDSIIYAQRIQQAIIPTDAEIKSYINDYGIFYLPKDVVSGDFYWAKKIGKYTIIAVADCTGHGVPGAFMSMLGISFLNEITKRPEIVSPNLVLDKLRENIIDSLRQKGKYSEQFDGMDMSIVVLNDDDNTIEYSGAYNPLYIISDKEPEILTENTKVRLFEEEGNSNKIYEIAPDKMPVAIHLRMNEFSNNKIKLNKGDQIVLFSDGYADQFGGVKGKKYRYKNFKSFLLKNSHKSINEQYNMLKNEFYSWKGEREQIDDITLMLFKV